MLYRAEPYQIDLHIEIAARSEIAWLSLDKLVDLAIRRWLAATCGSPSRTAAKCCQYSHKSVLANFAVRLKLRRFGAFPPSSPGKPIVILIRGALKRLSAAKDLTGQRNSRGGRIYIRTTVTRESTKVFTDCFRRE